MRTKEIDQKIRLQELPKIIAALLKISSPLNPPKLQFHPSRNAAMSNFLTIEKYNFNLHKILNSAPSITSFGSEFKTAKILHPLLHHHPRWEIFLHHITHGVSFHVTENTVVEQIRDLLGALKRGNHKSARTFDSVLLPALKKEILLGWMIPLLTSDALKIPGLELAPLGVIQQLGIEASGAIEKKWRVAHDLSFPGVESKESINSRVQTQFLEPCIFGHTILRIIHQIVNLRIHFPLKRIWLCKEDYKLAY